MRKHGGQIFLMLATWLECNLTTAVLSTGYFASRGHLTMSGDVLVALVEKGGAKGFTGGILLTCSE